MKTLCLLAIIAISVLVTAGACIAQTEATQPQLSAATQNLIRSVQSYVSLVDSIRLTGPERRALDAEVKKIDEAVRALVAEQTPKEPVK